MDEEAAKNNYAIGAITGAVKYQKYLRKEHNDDEMARKSAHRWALRQLAISGADQNEVLEQLRMTQEITERLIDTIEMAGMPKEKQSTLNDGYNNPK